MFRFTLIIVILNLTNTLSAFSTTLYSISDGNWNNSNIWSTISHNGPPCNCSPTSVDQVYIEHNVVLNKSLINQGSEQNGVSGILHIKSGATLNGSNFDIDIRSTGSLNLCGNLNARNMIFSNGSTILICTNGNLNLSGSFENKNNGTNVSVNGTMNVDGTFTNGTGGTISGTGSIGLSNGPIINNGTIMGCNNNPCNSFPCSIMSGCSTILPVELTELRGETFKNYIRVYWTTASEKDNDYFILEKSLDGINFSELSRIKGNGNSSITRSYAYRDLYPTDGSNYYRLKQFDYDGKSKTYDIIQVLFRTHYLLSVHPNPTNGKALNISLNISDGEAFIDILDLNGNSVYNVNKLLDLGKANNFSIEETKSLPQGIYTLRVHSQSGIQQEKLMVTQ